MPDKSAMRQAFREQRDSFVADLSEQERALAFSAVPSPLRALLTPDKIVSAYIPIGSEGNPGAFLDFSHKAGCKTALPFVTSKVAPMRFLQWRPGDPLVEGPFGLMQPDENAVAVTPDVIFVPLVAFDRALNRIGQGAGHYDRALSLMEEATAIGIAWSVQEADIIPADPWDIPLTAILTEKEWISR